MLNDQVRAHELGAGEKKSTSSCSSKTTGKRLHETVATLIPMDEEVEDKGIVDGLSQHFSDNDEDEEEEEEEEDEQDGEKDDDDRATNSLQTLIEGLDSRNKSSSSNKQKKAMENITEACEESEYNISSNAAPDSKKRKLEINDLMGVLSDTTGFGGLKKQLEILDSRHSSSNGGTVAVPLAKRAQDKIERDVAYIKAKSEIKKWVPIVSKNRIADNLSFPMNVAPDYKTSNGELVSKFQVINSCFIL